MKCTAQMRLLCRYALRPASSRRQFSTCACKGGLSRVQRCGASHDACSGPPARADSRKAAQRDCRLT